RPKATQCVIRSDVRRTTVAWPAAAPIATTFCTAERGSAPLNRVRSAEPRVRVTLVFSAPGTPAAILPETCGRLVTSDLTNGHTTGEWHDDQNRRDSGRTCPDPAHRRGTGQCPHGPADRRHRRHGQQSGCRGGRAGEVESNFPPGEGLRANH